MMITAERVRAVLGGLWLVLIGCLPAYAVPSIESVTPEQIAAQKSAQIQVDVSEWPPGASLALLPGGPYLKQTTALQANVHDIAISDGKLFLAADAGITVYDAATLKLLFFSNSGRCIKIFIDSGHLYCVDGGHKILIFKIQSERLEALGEFLNDATIKTILVANEHAFVLQDSALKIADIHDRNTPALLSILPLPSGAIDLAILNERLFVATGENGVLSIDISNKAKPTVIAGYSTNGAATHLQTHNDHLYVSDDQAGLVVLEIQSDTLQWRGSHNAVGRIRALHVANNKAVVLNEQGDLISLDLTNPALPTITAAIKTTPGTSAFAVAGQDVFSIESTILSHFDISAMAPIVSNENLDMGQGVNFGGQRKGFVDGDILYVADWFSGLHIYDIRQPQRPILLSSYHTPGSSKGVVVSNGYAFVADDDHGLQIVDVHIPTAPQFIAEFQTAGLAYTPKLDGDKLYLASHRGGVQIIDVSNVAAPKLLGEFMTGDKAWSIDVKDNLAYVANAESGLLIFDVQNPTQVRLIGQFNPGGNAEDIVVRGNYAFVTFFDQGLHIVDISDPAHPTAYGQIATPGNARGIELDGDVAYVADWFAGVHVIDISVLNTPKIISSFDTSGATWGVRAKGAYLYAFDWWGGLVVLNTQDPAKLRFTGRYLQGDVTMLRAHGDYLFAAHGADGLQIFDIRNPLNPTWMTGVDLPHSALDLALHNDYAYVATGQGGIAVVDVHNPFQGRLVSKLPLGGEAFKVSIESKNILLVRRDRDLLRVDISDPLEPRINEILAQDINDVWSDSGFIYTASDDGVVVRRTNNKQVYRYAGAASLIRAKQNIVGIYAPNDGITVLNFNQGKFTQLSRLHLDEPVVDFQLSDSQLVVALANFEVRSYDLSQPDKPHLLSIYRTMNRPSSIIAHRAQFYLATDNGIVAINPIPSATASASALRPITFSVPPLPDGWYDLAIVEGAHITTIRHNSLRAMAQRFSKPKITIDQFQKLLREKTQGPRP